MNYGEYFGLDARNAYLATASLGNLGGREPMNAVYRTAGLAKPVGGNSPQVWVISTTGILAGVPALGAYPAPYTGSETGTYAQERGGTAYEFTNHPSAPLRTGLGNVLAVVSDMKLGQGGTSLEPFATYYHPETRMLTDYYPFGSPSVGRSSESGEYRYGKNSQEKVVEISGSGNHNIATHWEYGPRLGRRWDQDPKPNPSISNSASSAKNDLPHEFLHKIGLLDRYVEYIGVSMPDNNSQVVSKYPDAAKNGITESDILAGGKEILVKDYWRGIVGLSMSKLGDKEAETFKVNTESRYVMNYDVQNISEK